MNKKTVISFAAEEATTLTAKSQEGGGVFPDVKILYAFITQYHGQFKWAFWL